MELYENILLIEFIVLSAGAICYIAFLGISRVIHFICEKINQKKEKAQEEAQLEQLKTVFSKFFNQ